MASGVQAMGGIGRSASTRGLKKTEKKGEQPKTHRSASPTTAASAKAKLRNDRQPATRANQTWAMDFVHDQLATGRKLRVLTIVDTYSRFSRAVRRRCAF